jgi:fused signal recognition particle receptor
LLASDVGVRTSEAILGRLREGLVRKVFGDETKVWEALRAEAVRILSVEGQAGAFEIKKKPTVVMLVGVNGAGKTTTIGKLATQLKAQGKTCVLAAGDTFRAAAVQQLKVWGERVGCEVINGKDGADPGSVVFEAIKRAIEVNADVVLADTAGRLHTKTNLMTQMKKIAKTADKALSGAPHETLLVIDATNGQNATAQATEFKEALGLTGIVLTKLDGTAKGGMILGICDTLRVPVRFVGLGERPDDLHEFSPDAFVEALLGRDS